MTGRMSDVIEVTQNAVDRYAQASGDFNPLHVDPGFAAGTPFGGTIAHGLFTLAHVSRLLSTVAPEAWSAGGDVEVAFIAPVRTGMTLTLTLIPSSDETTPQPMTEIVTYEILCEADGCPVLKGTATLPAPGARA